MRKILGIVVLGLLLCNNAYASCADNIEINWNMYEIKNYAKFDFASTSSKTIRISKLELKTSDGRVIEQAISAADNFYVKPFGVKSFKYYIGDLNQDMISTAGWSCRYVDPALKPKKTKPIKKAKKTEENSVLVLLVVFAIIGFIIYKLSGSKSNPDSNFRSKSKPAASEYKEPPHKNLNKNSVKVLSIKEFNKKIKNYIPSHQISSLPRIGDVEGQEFQCGCGNSHIMNFDQHYFIADGGLYKAIFLSPDCKYLNALKLKGPMTNGIKNLCSTKYLSDKPKYGFDDYPDIAGAIDKFFL